jgi:hypothetical protein
VKKSNFGAKKKLFFTLASMKKSRFGKENPFSANPVPSGLTKTAGSGYLFAPLTQTRFHTNTIFIRSALP